MSLRSLLHSRTTPMAEIARHLDRLDHPGRRAELAATERASTRRTPPRAAAVGLALVLAACGTDGGGRPECVALEPAPPDAPGAARLAGAPYPPFHGPPQGLAAHVRAVVGARREPFDWARADDGALCAALAGDGLLVVGVAGDRDAGDRARALDGVTAALGRVLGGPPAVVDRNDRLGTLRLGLADCGSISAIRALPGVAFVEPDGTLATPLEAPLAAGPAAVTPPPAHDAHNPGRYDPGAPGAPPYAAYVEPADPDSAARIRRQRMEAVYDELGHFGRPEVGVAVVDNGVLPEWVPYLSTGAGGYRTAGYRESDPAAVHPQPDDFFGLAQAIPNTTDHGTRQSRQVQSFAPQAGRATVRASSIPFLFAPADLAGTTRALLALADDDSVRIVSLSMGTILRSRELERAALELHARGKILVAAAGTTAPIVRDLVGVVFPATLPTAVSTTGLADTDETGGVFELGATSHGGPENDFVIEPSQASSESVSAFAGILATLWGIDPDQPPESVLDALIRSSTSYRASGAKDAVFGWGRVDASEAARTIERGGCALRRE